jgi:hypothetical protein
VESLRFGLNVDTEELQDFAPTIVVPSQVVCERLEGGDVDVDFEPAAVQLDALG